MLAAKVSKYSFERFGFKTEIMEFEKNPCGQEMGDVMEVLDAIIKLKNIDRSLIKDYQQLKLHENGGFNERIVLKSVKIYDK